MKKNRPWKDKQISKDKKKWSPPKQEYNSNLGNIFIALKSNEKT